MALVVEAREDLLELLDLVRLQVVSERLLPRGVSLRPSRACIQIKSKKRTSKSAQASWLAMYEKDVPDGSGRGEKHRCRAMDRVGEQARRLDRGKRPVPYLGHVA